MEGAAVCAGGGRGRWGGLSVPQGLCVIAEDSIRWLLGAFALVHGQPDLPAWRRLEGDLPASLSTCSGSLHKMIKNKQEFLTETRCVVV